jgi:hypothetical protein
MGELSCLLSIYSPCGVMGFLNYSLSLTVTGWEFWEFWELVGFHPMAIWLLIKL